VLFKYDLRNLPYQVAGTDLMLGTLVVYGLTYDNHTITIVADDHNDEDVHFLWWGGNGTHRSARTHNHAASWLGLTGLAGVRRKFKN